MDNISTELGVIAAAFIISVGQNIWQHVSVRRIRKQTEPNGSDTNLTLREKIDEIGTCVKLIQDLAIRHNALEELTWLLHDAPPNLVYNHPVAVWVGDSNGKNIRTSEGYYNFFGIEGMELDWYQVIDREKSPEYITDFLSALKSGVTRFNRSKVYLKLKQEENSVACEIRCRIVHDEKGNAVRSVGLVFRSNNND